MLDQGIVKELCEKASQESNAEKSAELTSHLRNLIEVENDEVRLRIRQIFLHYRNHLSISLTEKPRTSMSSFVAALVSGLRASASKGN